MDLLESSQTPANLPPNRVPGVHSILGVRGSGKSCLFRSVCLEAERLVIVDTLGEHCQSGYVEYVHQISDLIEKLREPAFRVGYCPSPNGYEEVEYIERLVASRYQITLGIDEIDKWYPNPMSVLGDGLASIVNYGRHWGQGLVSTVRRPAAISRHLTAQGVLWAFPMRDDRDRGYVVKNIGIDPGSIDILATDANGYTVETEVLRHERTTQVLRFHLLTGELHELSRPAVQAVPLLDDAPEEPEQEPEPEPVQEPAAEPLQNAP